MDVHAQARSHTAKPGRFTKRARVLTVLLFGMLVIGFVVYPLLYNGYLFPSPMKDDVYAAAALPTQSPAPALTPAPSAPAPTPAPTPVPPMEISLAEYPALAPESDSDAVAVLQKRLMELGYFDFDEITTYYGTVTESAVMLFQRAQELPQTGIADSETLRLLYSTDAQQYHMKAGDKGSDVRSMQRRLTELGYYEDKDNGYFGVATQNAVLRFQKRNKLPETGEVDIDARNLLYSPDARYLVDPTPTPKPTQKPTPKPSATGKPSATKKPSGTSKPNYEIPVITPEIWPTPAPQTTAAPSVTSAPPIAVGSYETSVAGLIQAAKAQLGKPYVWSEEGPDSFDCSGLVYYCLRLSGVSVSRYNSVGFSQVSSWQPIAALSECRAGDILFYKSDTNAAINHTGIYLGGGQFLHASSSAGKVMISATSGYYERNFVIARRVFQ